MSEHPLLTVEALACERDDRLLFSDMAFTARAGEIWQVAGPNGAGKTTLLRILAGLFGFYEGVLRWRQDLVLRQAMLYLGHRPGLREELSPLENLTWLSALHGQCDDNALMEALAAAGLAGFEDLPVAHLSAGQKRRVALARLWLPGKPVWILDEPFTAIDAEGIALVEERLRHHAAQGGLVIYTSHHRLAADTRQILLGQGAAEVRMAVHG
ncbi:cytochrome c biogenesis heme-transporting ATPase CcmA [Isoalcanivorax indicus]|uniref:cytochrome c biogenesis heme-transporting ATPase CcmA n=1 Tax=Isoalcanivorax indicus TaxID=2202653 RepID=UPI001FE39E1E|nr:cytochrome c biogenesis heme-transporting ATPase CcmA [Isoalcanivorax indicus]